jgi:hypothetical protein
MSSIIPRNRFGAGWGAIAALLTLSAASGASGQTEAETYSLGAYTLAVPAGWSARQLQTGIIELRSTAGPAPVTAQLAPQRIDFGVASPAAAVNYLANAMRQWNPQQPMQPFSRPARIDRHVRHLGGSAATQAYAQDYADGQGYSGAIHGLFTLHLTSAGQAIVIDLFVPGSAQGVSDREWQYLVDLTKLLLNHLRTR